MYDFCKAYSTGRNMTTEFPLLTGCGNTFSSSQESCKSLSLGKFL
jgi:hypothetical protein